MLRMLSTMVAGFIAAGCGTAAVAHREADQPRFSPYSTVLGAEELRAAHAVNLIDAIATLRPQFLAASGIASRQPTVIVDDIVFGTVADLRLLRVADVERIQFLSASDAVSRFGRFHDAGAIVVTRRGRWP
jgi:hypothetical protein